LSERSSRTRSNEVYLSPGFPKDIKRFEVNTGTLRSYSLQVVIPSAGIFGLARSEGWREVTHWVEALLNADRLMPTPCPWDSTER